MSATDSVTTTIEVGVDPVTAFEVFTEDIDAWYQRGPHSWKHPERAVGIRFEPGVGGRWIEVWDEETGEGYDFGRITAWEPGKRLVFDYLLHDGGHVTEVEIRFEPTDGGTRVVLEHRGWDALPPAVAAQGVANVQKGEPVLLGWFAEYMEKGGEMSSVEFRGITPYLHYEDAAAALDWLARVFGFAEVSRYVDDGGRVREAEMRVGDQQLWLSGRDPGYWDEKGRGPEQLILIWVDDVDAQYERVKAAGIDAESPVDKPYGVRSFDVTDPDGYEWGFMQPTGKGYEQSEGGLTELRT